MKKFILIFLILPVFSVAQNFSEYNQIISDSTSKSHTILVNGSGYVSSNSLRSDVFNAFLWGGNISSTQKQDISDALKTTNLFGANAHGSVSFLSDESDRFGKGTSLIIAYNHYLFNDLKTNRALPDILFNGNNGYLGTSVSLNNTSLNMLNYGSLSIGLLKTVTHRSNIHTFGLSMGYAMGISNTTLDISSGQLKFANDGSAIDLNAIYQLSTTDTSNSTFLNGNGWVSSFFYEFTKPNSFSVSFFMEDFGQIYWKKESLSGQKKANIHFEGFQIADLVHINNDEINHAKDSLVNSLYYPTKAREYQTLTPCKIGMSGTYFLTNKIAISGSIWQYLNTNQRVSFIVKPIFKRIFSTVDLAPFLISNGYNPIDFGLECMIKSIKNTLIKATLYSIPFNSHTLGGALMIGYRF